MKRKESCKAGKLKGEEKSTAKHCQADGHQDTYKKLKVKDKIPNKILLGAKNKIVSSNWLQLQKKLIVSGHKNTRKVNTGEQSVNEASSVPSMTQTGKLPVPLSENDGITKVLAMDCEMVGVGMTGNRSMLARVCLVNSHGNIVYDKYVRPVEKVTDYRTRVSGIRKADLTDSKAEDFWIVQREVAELLNGRILVGHALHNDLKVLMLSHPKKHTRDTQKYKDLKKGHLKRGTALRVLASEILGVSIQQGEHSPADDARAAMYIYLKFKNQWEKSLHTPVELQK